MQLKSKKRKQSEFLKNEKKIWIDSFPKKTYRWLTGIGKDAQRH